CRGAGAAKDDDGGGHHGRVATHYVEHRDGFGGDATDCSTDDWRNDFVGASTPHCHPRHLWSRPSLESASLAGGAVTSWQRKLAGSIRLSLGCDSMDSDEGFGLA